MRVPRQHLGGFVAGDALHNRRIQPPLEEPAGGLMAQIVEVEVLEASHLDRFEK